VDEGSKDGLNVGRSDGVVEGPDDGKFERAIDGRVDGVPDAKTLGKVLGFEETLGKVLGLEEGAGEGPKKLAGRLNFWPGPSLQSNILRFPSPPSRHFMFPSVLTPSGL